MARKINKPQGLSQGQMNDMEETNVDSVGQGEVQTIGAQTPIQGGSIDEVPTKSSIDTGQFGPQAPQRMSVEELQEDIGIQQPGQKMDEVQTTETQKQTTQNVQQRAPQRQPASQAMTQEGQQERFMPDESQEIRLGNFASTRENIKQAQEAVDSLVAQGFDIGDATRLVNQQIASGQPEKKQPQPKRIDSDISGLMTDVALGQLRQAVKEGKDLDEGTRGRIISDLLKNQGIKIDMDDPRIGGLIKDMNANMLQRAGVNDFGELQESFISRFGSDKNLSRYDANTIAYGLQEGVYTQQDLDVLKAENPEKFSEVQRQQEQIQKIDRRNKQFKVGDQESQKTTLPKVDRSVPQMVDQQQQTTTFNLVDLYDEMVETDEVNALGDQVNEYDTQISTLDEKKFNLMKDLEEQYPNASQDTLARVYADRVEGIDRQIRTLAIQREGLSNKYDSIKQSNMRKYEIAYQQINKMEDRAYQEMVKKMDFEQKKSLMMFEQDMRTAVPDLDKTVTSDGRIVMINSRTGEAVSVFDPNNTADPINYLKQNGEKGGQCGEYVNNILQKGGVARLFGDSLDQKISVTQRADNVLKDQPYGVPGAAIVLDTGAMSLDGSINYGHVGIIQGIDPETGEYIINSSNMRGDETVSIDRIKVDDPKIRGFYANQNMLGEQEAGAAQGALIQEKKVPEFSSDGQRKAFGFANRILDSNLVLEDMDLGSKVSSMNPIRYRTYSQAVGTIGNNLVPGRFQQYDQARRNFINAILRQESGAAIAESEFNSAERQYFPVPGDSKETIEQKRENRESALESMAISSGKDGYNYILSDTNTTTNPIDQYLGEFEYQGIDLSTYTQ